MEAGFEELAGIANQVHHGDGGQQIEQTAPAIKIARGNIQRESTRGADGGRVPSRYQRIDPRGGRGDGQRADFGKKTQPQEKQQEGRQDGDVQTVDDQHVVGAGAAKTIGPQALHTAGLSDERGLHHAGGIGIAGIEALDAP